MTVRRRQNRWVTDFQVPVTAAGANPAQVSFRRYRLSLGPEIQSRLQALQAEERIRAGIEAGMSLDEARTLGIPPPAKVDPVSPPTGLVTPPGRAPKDQILLIQRPPGPGVERQATWSFSGLAKRWWDVHCVPQLKPSTQRRYHLIIAKHLYPAFGDRDITTITAFDVQDFRARSLQSKCLYADKHLCPKTVNEHINVLSAMMQAAVEWGYLKVNPCRGLKQLRVVRKEMQFYDREQTTRFLDKAKNLYPELVVFLLTAFRTGLRLGELTALAWPDVDLNRRVIHVRSAHSAGVLSDPKSGKSRVVDLSPALAEALAAMPRHPKSRFVFTRRDGTPLTRDNIKNVMQITAREAGLPPIRPHDMRHSFASQLVMAGTPLAVVKSLLGHSTLEMTMRYAHLSPETLRDAVAVLDD